LRDQLNTIISKHSGRTIEQVIKDTDRNNFMSPEEAKTYGLLDEIIEKRK
jgi:ATP-dependent Clp protease protease subunit